MTGATSVADKVGTLSGNIEPRGQNAVATTEPPVEGEIEPTLDQLVVRFKVAHGGIVGGVRRAAEAQIECGRLLTLMHEHIKATIGGGYWGAWVIENCNVSLRQVQRYKKRWDEYQAINQNLKMAGDAMSLLSQRDLQRMNSDPRRKRSAKKKTAK